MANAVAYVGSADHNLYAFDLNMTPPSVARPNPAAFHSSLGVRPLGVA